VDLDVELRDSRLQAFLRVRNSLVVDKGPELFQKETKERAGGDVAYLLLHVFEEVAFDGSNRLLAGLFGDFNRHEQGFLAEGLKPESGSRFSGQRCAQSLREL